MPNLASKLVNYIKASIEELKKVAWPTRAETTRYSLLVIGISLAIATAIGIVDFFFTLGIETITSLAS